MSDHDHSCGQGRERPNLSCREISEFILAYLERDLDGEAREEFEQHLSLCPPCGHYLDGYRDTIKLVRACARAPADAQHREQPPPEGLIQAILSAKRCMKPPDAGDS